VLAPSPDILLLDEPTNHLDLPTIEWLEGELDSRRSALVIISHDRRFLSNLSRSTAWLDRGQIKQIDRGFGAFETWRDEVLAEEEREQHSSTARSSTKNTGCATAFPGAQAQRQAARQSARAARPAPQLSRRDRRRQSRRRRS